MSTLNDLKARVFRAEGFTGTINDAAHAFWLDALNNSDTTITGGTIDDTVIGGTTPAAGTFTTLNATGGGALTGTWTDLGTVTTIDINGGTIDGVVIGGAVPAAGDFTDLSSSNTADFSAAGVHLGGVVAANLLDDYEEGIFTPALIAGTSGTITLNASLNTLSYTKIGDTVHVRGLLRVTSISSPLGTLRLTGLPFTSANYTQVSERAGFYIHASGLASAVTAMVGEILGGATEITIARFDGTDTNDDAANLMAATPTNLTFDFSYPAA